MSKDSVMKIEMISFGGSDPIAVLGLVQTPERALDDNRKKVEEYIALRCTDEQIAEALRLTTKKDFWSADHVKKARARWRRADKKAAEASATEGASSKPKQSKKTQATENKKVTPDDTAQKLRIFSREEILDDRVTDQGMVLRDGMTAPGVDEVYMTEVTGDKRFKALRIEEHAYGGNAVGIGRKKGTAVYHTVLS